MIKLGLTGTAVVFYKRMRAVSHWWLRALA
jgi:hypothetical protein